MAGKFWDRGVTLVPGCQKVSAGCIHCWSEGKGRPFPNPANKPYLDSEGNFTGKVGWRLDLLEDALKSKKDRVLAIWNDFYHPGITNEQRDEALNLIGAHQQSLANPRKVILIVTKRPEIAARYWWDHCIIDQPEGFATLQDARSSNIWHLVTMEDQWMANKRIKSALRIPTKLGILIEPMLGPVDLTNLEYIDDDAEWRLNVLTGEAWREDSLSPPAYDRSESMKVDQVLLGFETGEGARVGDPVWARKALRECKKAGVPFFMKSMGAHIRKIPEDLDVKELAWRES